MKPIKFKAILGKSPSDSGWHYIPVEAYIGDKFEKKNGSRRVVCTINGAETFQCALIHWGEIFTVIVNKEKRDKLRIVAGDRIDVVLEQDASKYGLPMPAEFKEVLKQDREGDKLFHSLTAGKQRSILYFVGKVKDVDKRIHTALIFIEHLKKNGGKIIHEKLREDLKRPIV
jgi:translation initiation factor IF-1